MPQNHLLAAKGDPIIGQTENDSFGNWTGSGDTKIIAADLMKRGLIGANQLLYDNPTSNTPDAIRNAQSDWKVAAIQKILSKAKELNIRKPEVVNANRNVLMSGIDPRYRDAINSQTFQVTHPNFWSVIGNSILPEQYAKYDKLTPNLIAKK